MDRPKIVFPNDFSFKEFDFPSAGQDKRGGMIRRTFVRGNLILQLSPAATDEMPEDDRRLLTPWLRHEDRIQLLEQVTLRAKEIGDRVSVGRTWSLEVPEFHGEGSGQVSQGNLTFPLVATQLVPGAPLEDNRWTPVTMNPLPATEELLQQLVDFLAQLHGCSIRNGTTSLQAHYTERLGWMERILGSPTFAKTLGHEAVESIRRILLHVVDHLGTAVPANETVRCIHGDFRENNLLVDAPERRCWIIDFDQGLTPGDYATDLWKLGLLKYEPGRMSGMLTQPLYDQLRARYAEKSNDASAHRLLGNPVASAARVELLLLDISFSILLYRFHMGFDFDTKALDGQTVRGTKFLIKLLQQQHDRIVQR